MDEVLAVDGVGNSLLGFWPKGEGFQMPNPPQPMPLALAAVWDGPRLLLVFNRYRQCWELPGGLIDPGESPYQAAVRELLEETGLDLPVLSFAGFACFQLVDKPCPEYAAVYIGKAKPYGGFVPNEEISAVCWWNPADTLPGGEPSLDMTLARLLTCGPGTGRQA